MDKLAEGDLVIFVDHKGRSFMQRLDPKKIFNFHDGQIAHEEVIGKPDGSEILTSIGKKVLVFRPTLKEYIMNMPRKSNIVYPKDISIILMWADVFPGARVVEAGSGSGALLLSLLRAVGNEGQVISYEEREDMLERARKNVERFGGIPPHLTLKKGNIYEQIEERDIDRIILDVPEPWRVLPHASVALKSGGIIVAYTPTIKQAEQFVAAVKSSSDFMFLQTIEVLIREWHIEGLSVRPEHRMVGHTGFLSLARKFIPVSPLQE
ncbi:tRNA (adenine-N1)-methyltransferase [Calderihabitans maritimus]|uniref:tRNA (adenine(58)-N(1))-methyltransferase TrmI n=1 Tax=Calderihabitans maritimus TaxID=1246530 RepID=A0A1Z5HQ43_9FIRM|nr:tRNA (adenine-N1)-methyltransferase [Calderihabitans maritimus]GAW91487.1 tRNA (adenine-N(1)-)-methyltransferase [Calderihabitans maritimus]